MSPGFRRYLQAGRFMVEWAAVTGVALLVARWVINGPVVAGLAGLWVSFYVVWVLRFVAMPPRRRLRRVRNRLKGRDPSSREPVPSADRQKAMFNWRGASRRCRMCIKRTGAELHHVWSWSWGGPNSPWNYRPLCGPCNNALSNRVTRLGQAVLFIPGPADWPVWLGWPFGVLAVIRYGGFTLT